MDHMGNGVHGQCGMGYKVQGYGAHGQWNTWPIGPHGQWGTGEHGVHGV